jgi:hypothetical protein
MNTDVTLAADDAADAADALEYLASVDEGEHTNYERLLDVARTIRQQFPHGSFATYGKGVLRDDGDDR